MVSTPLQRLRKAERDLAQWYTNTLTPKGKQSTADLKAMRNGYQQAGHPDMVAIIDRDIVARHAESRQRLAELQSEVREAAAAVQAKASRQRVPATDRALADVRSILASNNATASSVAQWIVREHPTEPEYWTALHEVASQQQAAAGLVGLPAKAAAQLVREVQQAIASYEPHTFSEAEGALALEAREVAACMGTLELNLRDASSFLEREAAGLDGLTARAARQSYPGQSAAPMIRRWAGLPDAAHPGGLLDGGESTIPLTDDRGNFIAQEG